MSTTMGKRPQDRGGGQHPRTRAFTRSRPEKVRRGLALAIAIRASRRHPQITEEMFELLIRDLQEHELVPVTEITLAQTHGSKRGARKPLTERQAEILQMYADGLAPSEMVTKTGTSRANIGTRLEAARFALDAKTNMQAIAIAVEARLVRGRALPHYEPKLTGPGSKRNPAKPVGRRQADAGEPTQRELEVLDLASQGLQNPAIAARLGVVEETVKTHLKTCYLKLGARNRAHAVAIALRRGLI